MTDINDKIKTLIKDTSSALQVVAMYLLEHPKVQETVKNLYEEFEAVFTELDEINLGVVGDEIFSGKETFFDLSRQVRDFIKVLQEKKIEYVKFRRGLSKEEISQFLKMLSIRKKSEEDESQELIFDENRFRHISIGKFGREETGDLLKKKSFTEKLSHFSNRYNDFVKKTGLILGDNIEAGQINYDSLANLASGIFDRLLSQKDILFSFLSIKQFDDYTFVHCLNVSILTIFQAKNLGLSKDKVVALGIAGFLHDLGKIAIHKTILNKPDKLTDEEFAKIKNHVIYGAKILVKQSHSNKLPLVVSFQHHIGYNMKGYPKAAFLENQHLASKLVSISDVYDALRTKRSYRESMPLEKIYEIMNKESGRLFDPLLLKLFFKYLGVWPVGTLVKLDTHQIGLVRESNPLDIFRPKVEIFFDSQAHRLAESFIVDLSQKDTQGKFRHKIISHLTPQGEGKRFINELLKEGQF